MRITRQKALQISIIAGLIIGVSLCHYSTSVFFRPSHDIYRRLYYIPIILSAFWFGLRGSVFSALLITAVYLPHIVLQWGGGFFAGNLEKTLEIILFNIIGLVTGYLSELQISTAARLKHSYRELKRKTHDLVIQEQQIRHMDRLSALGELSAGIAHEVRNPLASIMVTADILSSDGLPPDKRKEFSKILVSEISRLDRVIRNFLDFAKPKGPRKKLSNVKEIIESVIGLLTQQLRKNKIELVQKIDDFSLLDIDPQQIKQALLNIMLNAIQAMPDGGTFRVQAYENDMYAVIKVSDTGPGIPAEFQSDIFNPFFTTKQNGTGLGLSIVSNIIEAHGGKISVESRTASESGLPGTTFTIKLIKKNKNDGSKHTVGR